jgi:hypothetical protein
MQFEYDGCGGRMIWDRKVNRIERATGSGTESESEGKKVKS